MAKKHPLIVEIRKLTSGRKWARILTGKNVDGAPNRPKYDSDAENREVGAPANFTPSPDPTFGTGSGPTY